MTPISDRPKVIALALAQLQEKPALPAEDAVAAAIREVFSLTIADGIYGGSDAAVCLGWRGHDKD